MRRPPINWRLVAAYSAYVVGLHVVDGPWRSWKKGRAGKAVDPWTLQHVLWGVIAERMRVGREQILLLSAVNEVVELGVRTFRPDMLWGTPETPAMSLRRKGSLPDHALINKYGWASAKSLSL